MFENTLKKIDEVQGASTTAFEKVSVLDNPQRVIIIDGFLGKEINQKIMEQTLEIKSHFTSATIGNGQINKNVRSNQVCYLEEVFKNRGDSLLLTSFDKVFVSQPFREMMLSAGKPFCDFEATDHIEMQLSRYGDKEGQKYEWHVDRFPPSPSSPTRYITVVYYMFQEPKKFTGGSLSVSNGVLNMGKLMNDDAIVSKIEVMNDRALIFASTTPHCVEPTISSDEFGEGRFSFNIWIGFRNRMV